VTSSCGNGDGLQCTFSCVITQSNATAVCTSGAWLVTSNGSCEDGGIVDAGTDAADAAGDSGDGG
jgi:hypothetical protein